MMELNQDYKYNAGLKERMVLIAFRVSNQIAVKKKSNPLIWILGLPVLVLYRICIFCIYFPYFVYILYILYISYTTCKFCAYFV